jgi:hypothetical protein
MLNNKHDSILVWLFHSLVGQSCDRATRAAAPLTIMFSAISPVLRLSRLH